MESILTTPFGERLRRLREQRGWSQEQLARAAGVPREWISAVETGDIANPGSKRIGKLAQAFGVDADYLLSGDRPGEVVNVPTDREDADEVRRFASYPAWLKRALNALADPMLKNVPKDGPGGRPDKEGTH